MKINELHLPLVQTVQQWSVQSVGNTTLALAYAGLGTAWPSTYDTIGRISRALDANRELQWYGMVKFCILQNLSVITMKAESAAPHHDLC
jgi:hypothetical protein